MRVLAIAAMLALPACGVDKVLHAGAGFGVGAVTDEFIGDYGCEAAIAIGIAKELIDPIFSIPDVVATAAYCLTRIGLNETDGDESPVYDKADE